MASTYEPIATATASGSTALVSFGSIPATYTDIVAVVSVKTTATGTCWSYVNGYSASGLYSDTVLLGTGSAAQSFRNTTQNQIIIAEANKISSTDFTTIIVNYMNYANTTTFKTVLSRASSPSLEVDATVNLWRSTAAIYQIDFNTFSGSINFAAGSTFTLYGIKAA
jgi:hypothetical protein